MVYEISSDETMYHHKLYAFAWNLQHKHLAVYQITGIKKLNRIRVYMCYIYVGLNRMMASMWLSDVLKARGVLFCHKRLMELSRAHMNVIS